MSNNSRRRAISGCPKCAPRALTGTKRRQGAHLGHPEIARRLLLLLITLAPCLICRCVWYGRPDQRTRRPEELAACSSVVCSSATTGFASAGLVHEPSVSLCYGLQEPWLSGSSAGGLQGRLLGGSCQSPAFQRLFLFFSYSEAFLRLFRIKYCAADQVSI
jgi:hypothetical protein